MKYTPIFVISLFMISSGPIQSSKKQHQEFRKTGDVEFVIVIPSYKNENWAAENLASACNQKSSRPFKVICINDCSPDRTGEIMEEYVREHHLESMVTIIHNEKRLGAMANWYNTIHKHIPDHKVVVNLDGDDLLAHDQVLLTLEKYYRDPDVWLTYGSAIAHPSKEPIWYMSQEMPKEVFEKKELRKHPFITQHLRTFKAGLFKKIKKEDLEIEGVDLVPDMAFMIPMLEMCSPTTSSAKNHSRFIPEILYYYRTNNPLNLFRTHAEEQLQADKRLRAQKPYQPLDSLFARSSTSQFAHTKPQSTGHNRAHSTIVTNQKAPLAHTNPKVIPGKRRNTTAPLLAGIISRKKKNA